MTTRVKPIDRATSVSLDPPLAASQINNSSTRVATGALLLATLCWGCGFSWAKSGGEDVNRFTGAGENAALGPILLLGVRFTLAGLIWLIIFPKARSGWTRASFGRAAILGSLLSLGIVPQHLGLDRTSEAVSAFLTSLTIVFVPLISVFALRRPLTMRTWLAVAVAAAGVWLMTGAAAHARLGLGELLGLSCAVVFSVHTLAVNALVPRDDPFRMTGGQFLVLGIVSLIVTPFLRSGAQSLAPAALFHTFWQREALLNLLLLIAFPTIVAFGLHTQFQPRLDATRATLIYLMEPIFASLYAFVFVGRKLAVVQLIGAALILLANGLMELLDAWSRVPRTQREYAPREVV